MEYLPDFLAYIYRDISLEELHKDIREYVNMKGDEFLSKNLSRFVIETEKYKECFVKGFIHQYSQNYTLDEVKHLFDITLMNLHDFKHQTHYSVSSRLNSLDLIAYTSVKLTRVRSNELVVDFDNLMIWNELLNTLDINVIISSALAYNNLNSYCSSYIPKHDFKELNSLISLGIGETHMHLKASGYSTDINWQLFNEKPIKATEKLKFDEMIDFFEYKRKPLQFVENKQSSAYKLIKFIRYYLYDRVRSSKFNKLLNVTLDKKESRILNESNLLDLIQALDDGDYSKYEFEEDKILSYIVEDKMSFQQGAYNYVLAERSFLIGLFSLYYANELTPVERLIFNIYIVGASFFKFSFIQDNKGMGFSKFKSYEKNKTFYIKNAENKILNESVFDKYYREGSVKIIEVRVKPMGRRRLKRLVKELHSANDRVFDYHRRNNSRLEKIRIALILHYIKESVTIDFLGYNHRKQDFIEYSEGVADKITDFFDSESVNLEDIKTKKGDLTHFCIEDGVYINEIIGIDAANYELNCRPEALAVIFRKHMYDDSTKSRLGVTYHVGEEFMSLSNGLRAIDEYIEFFQLGRKDRIGHAIALGVNVTKYYGKKKNLIITSLQDYIDDLAWMYTIIRQNISSRLDLTEYLRDKLLINLGQLYSKKISKIDVEKYTQSLYLRGDDPKIYLFHDFCEIDKYKYYELTKKLTYKLNYRSPYHYKAFKDDDVRNFYFDYHYNNELKKKGEEKTTRYADFRFINCVLLCQKYMKEKVKNRGLTIEVNPSSNRKISFADSFNEIQLLGLNDHKLTHPTIASVGSNIKVTLNTDDGAVFQTTLYNEYSLIASSLVQDGYNRDSVLSYLNMIRENSNNTSFIKDIE